MNVSLISLGCTKNQIDSEMILGLFKKNHYHLTNQLEEAQVIIVNTCGFIESAKKEAIDTILYAADFKTIGKCKILIVTGCLAKRYKKQILEVMPEVDLCIGVDEYPNIDVILSKFLDSKFLNSSLCFQDRVISSKFPLAYVRISDGCDNCCSYCAIPIIRGSFRSRYMEDILAEVENLVTLGAREICVISQDTTRYGLDIYGKPMLKELISRISKISNIKWIRVLYMYPSEMDDDLIDEFKNNNKLCKYFDIPIQHISNKVLKDMNRRDTKEKIFNLCAKIRKKIPDAILRTTVIVGFPGETDTDFDELINAVKILKFERLGAFMFSKEEDTKAFNMKNQVSTKVKKERYDKLMTLQNSISCNLNKKMLNKELEVLVEDISDDEKYFVCRSYMDAPDVDGRIYIKIEKDNFYRVIIGEFYNVKITDYTEYDLFAKLI